jgi:hypothetical protein
LVLRPVVLVPPEQEPRCIASRCSGRKGGANRCVDRSLPRPGSKQAQIIALMQRKSGASLAAMVDATCWLPHTTRAALTGLRQKGYVIERDKSPQGKTVYRLPARGAWLDSPPMTARSPAVTREVRARPVRRVRSSPNPVRGASASALSTLTPFGCAGASSCAPARLLPPSPLSSPAHHRLSHPGQRLWRPRSRDAALPRRDRARARGPARLWRQARAQARAFDPASPGAAFAQARHRARARACRRHAPGRRRHGRLRLERRHLPQPLRSGASHHRHQLERARFFGLRNRPQPAGPRP